MTLFCPLNQPQCKRSIMTATGPFEKKECPLSKNRKCPFAPPVCPALKSEDGECHWPKIKGVIDQGGCKVGGSPLSRLAGGCCRVQKSQMQNPGQKSFPPENCAELPPCVRCTFGHPKEDEGIENSKKKAKQKNSASPGKDEETKQSAGPRYGRSSSVRSESNRLPDNGKTVARKSKIPCFKMDNAAAKISHERTRKATKIEEVKAQKSSQRRSKKSKVAEQGQKRTAPEKREEIFRKAVYDKVDKLQNREHLLVPQCSSASRQIMPCTSCLIDLLGAPARNPSPSSASGTRDEPEERCRIQRMLNTCTAFRVTSVCPRGCPCTEVPLLEDEEVDDDCPFLQHPVSSAPAPGCPLSRLSDHPLVLDPGRVSARGAGFDPCKCPIIPGNCCYTLPGCPTHTMRAVIDCPTLNRNI